MFGWLFDPIRRKVGAAIDRALKRQFGKFINRLQGLTSANVEALTDTVADSAVFQAANIPGQWLIDHITDTANKDSFDFRAVPITALEANAAISSGLAKRLAERNEVKAWATELNMKPAEVSQVLAAYSSSLVQFGIRSALEKLRKGQISLFGDYVVLSVEDGDAYTIKGDTRHRTMVRFVLRGELKQAEKFWNRRNNPQFKFQKNVFNK